MCVKRQAGNVHSLTPSPKVWQRHPSRLLSVQDPCQQAFLSGVSRCSCHYVWRPTLGPSQVTLKLRRYDGLFHPQSMLLLWVAPHRLEYSWNSRSIGVAGSEGAVVASTCAAHHAPSVGLQPNTVAVCVRTNMIHRR